MSKVVDLVRPVIETIIDEHGDMLVDMEYVKEPNTNKNVANRYNRKYIIENLGITKDNLSRYIKSFKEKGILIAGPAEDELSVNKALIPVVIGDRLQLTIILRIK